MSDVLIVGILSLFGTIVGSWAGVRQANKLVNYRIDKLEEKMSNYGKLSERTAINERDIETAFDRIDEHRVDIKEIKAAVGG